MHTKLNLMINFKSVASFFPPRYTLYSLYALLMSSCEYYRTHVFMCTLPTVTTRCVISELKSLGKELSGAMFVAKRFQLRRCGHEGKKKSATECILALIGQCTKPACV